MKKIIAAVFASAVMLMLTACVDFSSYEHLKTDIVGMWCDPDGPEYVEHEKGNFYIMYEFTDDGKLYHHRSFDGYTMFTEANYSISDNLLDVDGQKCRIKIENDVLTMIYDGGSSDYRRMTADEATYYGVLAKGNPMRSEQESAYNSANETTE